MSLAPFLSSGLYLLCADKVAAVGSAQEWLRCTSVTPFQSVPAGLSSPAHWSPRSQPQTEKKVSVRGGLEIERQGSGS